MTASDAILRISTDPDGLDFAALRAEGIALIQELSGKIWTDYNLHDPGVTILEQLCYGLTELAYQAGEGIDRFLSDHNGRIDFNHFGLYKPHEILPSAAVTTEDYCKLIVDAIPEIDAISVTPVDNNQLPTGLYHIAIRLLEPLVDQALDERAKQEIKRKVERIYSENRNLGEDLYRVSIENMQPCYLKGLIETTGRRTNSEIYAEIFFQCARKISSNVMIERYEDVYAKNKDLAYIFSGPLTQHGYIKSDDFACSDYAKNLQELSSLIAAIEGVKTVLDLEVVNEQKNPINHQDKFFLRFPPNQEYLKLLNLKFNNSNAADTNSAASFPEENPEQFLERARHQIHKLEFQYGAFRTNKAHVEKFYQLPKGRPHEALDYFSIQNHFPNVYGVNAVGLASSETAERKAKAKQLKAYLYPFEQLLANFQKQIQEMPQLFTLNHLHRQTYYSQPLDNRAIPQLEELYKSPTLSKQEQLEIQHRYDNVTDRINRALDTLLALYGEKLSLNKLHNFKYLHKDPDVWLLEIKVNYLKNLKTCSLKRGGGCNYFLEQWGQANRSHIAQKIGILLGIKNYRDCRPLTQVFEQQNISLVPDADFMQNQDPGLQYQPLAELTDDQNVALETWRADPTKKNRLGFSLLQNGVFLNRYALQHDVDGYRIRLQAAPDTQSPQADAQLMLPKKFADKHQAVLYAHRSKKIITQLNIETEGFHLLEHILLRQRCAAADQPQIDTNLELSFIFPAWGVRFADAEFREFAEQIICENLPAHLFPNIYWLDFPDMQAFEVDYKTWLTCLHRFAISQSQGLSAETDSLQLDQAASVLLGDLKQYAVTRRYWI